MREAWPTLTKKDKTLIRGDLSEIVRELRQVGQGSLGCFIGIKAKYVSHPFNIERANHDLGSINGGTLQDRFFKLNYEEGPFQTIKSFNDWLLAAATRQRPGPGGVTGPYREFLPDTGNIYFTYGDLTIGNIIISDGPGPRRIAGIVDWEQAGWYPEYWEYCKLLYRVEYTHEWRSDG